MLWANNKPTSLAHQKVLLCKEQETKADWHGDTFRASEELAGTGDHIMRPAFINWFDFETFSVTFYWSRQVPSRCKSNIPRGGVELRGEWAGSITLTVSFPHRLSAQIPFLVGKLVNTSTSHTSHFTAHERGERCEVRDWKQQEHQLQAPAAIQHNSSECTLFPTCWDSPRQSEHLQLCLDDMFVHLESSALSNSLSK